MHQQEVCAHAGDRGGGVAQGFGEGGRELAGEEDDEGAEGRVDRADRVGHGAEEEDGDGAERAQCDGAAVVLRTRRGELEAQRVAVVGVAVQRRGDVVGDEQVAEVTGGHASGGEVVLVDHGRVAAGDEDDQPAEDCPGPGEAEEEDEVDARRDGVERAQEHGEALAPGELDGEDLGERVRNVGRIAVGQVGQGMYTVSAAPRAVSAGECGDARR